MGIRLRVNLLHLFIVLLITITFFYDTAFAASSRSNSSWLSALISWVPMLLLIGVWVYFMRQYRASSQSEYLKRYTESLERCEVSLERIADSLEKRREDS